MKQTINAINPTVAYSPQRVSGVHGPDSSDSCRTFGTIWPNWSSLTSQTSHRWSVVLLLEVWSGNWAPWLPQRLWERATGTLPLWSFSKDSAKVLWDGILGEDWEMNMITKNIHIICNNNNDNNNNNNIIYIYIRIHLRATRLQQHSVSQMEN